MGWGGVGGIKDDGSPHPIRVSIDDVYKLNISYQCIKMWHRRDLKMGWYPSRPDLLVMCQPKPDVNIEQCLRKLYIIDWTIMALQNGYRFLLGCVGLGRLWTLVGWVGVGVRKWTHDQLCNNIPNKFHTPMGVVLKKVGTPGHSAV